MGPVPENAPDIHDKLMAVAKRRGYLQPSYEIYGGVAGFYDYGPLGARLKRNVEDLWRELYVLGEGMAEIECPNVAPEQVFQASGHLGHFTDTVIECPSCGAGNRGDHLVRGEWKRLLGDAEKALRKAGAEDLVQPLTDRVEAVRAHADANPAPANIRSLLEGTTPEFTDGVLHEAESGDVTVTATATKLTVTQGKKTLVDAAIRCPSCETPLDVGKAAIEPFNLMFKTQVGPGRGRAGYMRPETAQSMFMDFEWLYRFFREKMPFGAVQLGRAYRNEISPRQAMLRLREFNQMEAEVFLDPEAKSWPRWDALKDRELNLLRATTSEPVVMTAADAVSKGVIANEALGYFMALTDVFLTRAGIPKDVLRYRQHEPTEKAHYSSDTWDAEFLSPRFGWVEIVGIADRTDYDLKAHQSVSGASLKALRRFDEPKEVEVNRIVPVNAKLGPLFKKQAPAVAAALEALHPDHVAPGAPLTVEVDGETVEVPADAFEVETGTERQEGVLYTPHVVEPSYGLDRILYATLESVFDDTGEWPVLRLASRVAPVKAGVFPLMAKDGLDDVAREIEADLRAAGLVTQYDDGGSIGRRYARQDEIGTPFCVTVDYETKEDGTVTLRDRDTARQKRIPRDAVVTALRRLVHAEIRFDDVEGADVA